MSNELGDGLIIQMPLWALVSEEVYEETGGEEGFVFITDSVHQERSFPIFTDHDLAESYITQLKMAGVVLLPVESIEKLEGWFSSCIEEGINYATVDPTTDPRKRSWVATFGEVLKRASNG